MGVGVTLATGDGQAFGEGTIAGDLPGPGVKFGGARVGLGVGSVPGVGTGDWDAGARRAMAKPWGRPAAQRA